MKSPNKMADKSAMKMAKSPMKRESAAQEKSNLIEDMPLKMMKTPAKMAGKSPMQMGEKSPMKMGGSWMSKHSALKMMKSPAKLYKKK